MRGWLAAAVLLVVLGGCLGGGANVVVPTEPPYDTRLGDPTTIEGTLNRTPNVKVYGATTLKWDFSALQGQDYKLFASLVYFNDSYPINNVRLVGQPHLVAFVPINVTQETPACGPTPYGIKAMFRPRHGDGIGNLSGKTEPGWYHFVIIAKNSGTTTISFNTTTDLKPRNVTQADPYVTGGAAVVSTGRTQSIPVAPAEGTWLAYAHQIVPRQATVDGGREQTLAIAVDCAKATRTVPATGGATLNEATLSAEARGNLASFSIDGTYKPSQDVYAPKDTTTSIAWVHIGEVAAQDVAPESEPAPSASA